MKIHTFDTTLRDGTQGESISFSVDDKIVIAQKLDELGIDYIEGGWPGSNPKDQEFFKRATALTLHHARLTAFGSTRFARNPVHEDRNVRALVEAGTPVVSIFGKTWDLHVKRALGITNDQNLVLISETVRYIKDHGKEVVYDAEHFFDGYIANPDYALRTLEPAHKAGADVRCLCDTNGGTVTPRLIEIVAEVRRRFDGIIGIHTHNDGDLAVANTLAAVEAGVTHVQGCMNGYGERCGNANLASVIANLELKLQHTTIGSGKLAGLAGVCRFIAELANLPLRNDQPFVGKSAFAHKGGVHVSAVLKDSATYEHIKPELVGNRQRVLVSDLSGRGNIIYKLKQHGLAGRREETPPRNSSNASSNWSTKATNSKPPKAPSSCWSAKPSAPACTSSTSQATKSSPAPPPTPPLPPPPSRSRRRTMSTPQPNPDTAPSTPSTSACASAFPSSIRKSPTSA